MPSVCVDLPEGCTMALVYEVAPGKWGWVLVDDGVIERTMPLKQAAAWVLQPAMMVVRKNRDKATQEG